MLLGFGAASAALIVFVAWRMEGLDHEGVPVNLALRTLAYWPWLLWQIVLANLAVAKVILSPHRADPDMDWIPASQKTDVGRVFFANSITLTPGTISVQVDDDRILVHALQADSLEDLREGTMDRRVSWVERPAVGPSNAPSPSPTPRPSTGGDA